MDKEVYIIGGGSSLKGFPFEKLKGLDTIAVNMAALDVPNPTYSITADSRIFRMIQEGRFKNVTTSWVMVSRPDHVTMQYTDGKIRHKGSGYVYNPYSVDMFLKFKKEQGIGFSFNDFRTGYNSGFCAFQLAVLLGYKKICLLGIDLKEGDATHYHKRYEGHGINQNDFDRYYDNFVRAFFRIKRKTDIRVVSCSPISKLNQHIPYLPFEDTRKDHLPIFVSHYTWGTPYEEEVKKLIHSLKEFRLDYDIEAVPTLGSWRANSNYCATQVQNMLKKHYPRPVIRIDADAIVLRKPELFFDKTFTPDIAACIWNESKYSHSSRTKYDGELLGGTMFFANTVATRAIVDKWVGLCECRPGDRNGDLLQKILTGRTDIHFERLPLSYCKIFDFMKEMVPVIEHYQASRKYKRGIDNG